MENIVLAYENSKINCVKFGQGAQLLVALHGFGERGSMFQVLEPALGNIYTIYAIDLPYHGRTIWNKNRYDREDIFGIVQAILTHENKERFTLMGYSFGGRLSQFVYYEFITQIDKLYLFAPDGLEKNRFFERSRIVRRIKHLFIRVLNKPTWIFHLLRVAYRIGIISKFKHDFTYNHIKTQERRDRIFNTWTSMEEFISDPVHFKSTIVTQKTPVEAYFGTRDEVILAKYGEWLAAGVPNIEFFLLEEGHLLVDKQLNALLQARLL
jgi:pimeloyl-ACP methyl ester carboxylesterase